MNVKVEVRSQESWRRVLAIEVPAEDAAQEYDRVARKFAQEVRLPGFRKGKVPSAVVRKSFKGEVDREFLEEIVPKAFGQALEETKLSPVSDPKFAEISFGDERPLSFVAEFESLPELEIQGHKGLAIEKEVPEVPDTAIEEVLEDFRKSHASLIEVDREAIAGDVLVLDAQAVDAGGKPVPERALRNHSLELGVGQAGDPLETALVGAKAGDVRVADLGEPAQRYRMKVRKVQEKKFPSLDDTLVAAHTDAATLEELRARVRGDLESRADRMGTTRVEGLLLERVIDANPFEPPESVVEALLDDLIHRARHDAEGRGENPDAMDANALKESNREGARRQARRMIVLDLLSRQEKIEVETEELRERVDRLARLRGTTPRELVRQLGGDRFLRSLSREIRDKKVLAFLVQNAEITPKTVRLAPA